MTQNLAFSRYPFSPSYLVKYHIILGMSQVLYVGR